MKSLILLCLLFSTILSKPYEFQPNQLELNVEDPTCANYPELLRQLGQNRNKMFAIDQKLIALNNQFQQLTSSAIYTCRVFQDQTPVEEDDEKPKPQPTRSDLVKVSKILNDELKFNFENKVLDDFIAKHVQDLQYYWQHVEKERNEGSAAHFCLKFIKNVEVSQKFWKSIEEGIENTQEFLKQRQQALLSKKTACIQKNEDL